ncbi:hypothetical protein BB560_000876 [Smittium megazygosporum]|uniref:DUF4112 domain-containing protein n=1 Tax=Smittium megazygosporum TaxID=133381 RepID=A0A2T9ZJ36_9FUNG|nr:hypothetical protein BB560_000876 [Smittium megazygosporum]
MSRPKLPPRAYNNKRAHHQPRTEAEHYIINMNRPSPTPEVGVINKLSPEYNTKDTKRNKTQKHLNNKSSPQHTKKKSNNDISKDDIPKIKKKLKRAKKVAVSLDCRFSLCGFKVGLDSLIGLIPVFGDFAGFIISLLFALGLASDFNLPFFTLLRMILNCFIDMVLGIVPGIGDVADALYKANMKNYKITENYLNKKYKVLADK